MKKILFGTLTVAVISLFAACQKDGKYNPKEKISNVYEESLFISSLSYGGQTYSDTNQTPKRLTERWTWDGKKLTQVVHVYYTQEWNGTSYTETPVEETVKFTYDGDQLTEANDGDELIVFTYDGKKLQKAEVYEDNQTTPYTTLVFEYDGKRISTITATTTYTSHFDKSQPALGRMERLLLSNMLPDMKPVEMVFAKARKSGAKETSTSTIEFTWDGDNVSKMVVKEGSYTANATYTYDDKKNPYQGFLYVIPDMMDDGPSFTNENNVVKAVYQYSAEESSETNYTYTYDGKWPTSRTEVYSNTYDDYSYYDRITKYFEYK